MKKENRKEEKEKNGREEDERKRERERSSVHTSGTIRWHRSNHLTRPDQCRRSII